MNQRIVLLRFDRGANIGDHRPALIVRGWGGRLAEFRAQP